MTFFISDDFDDISFYSLESWCHSAECWTVLLFWKVSTEFWKARNWIFGQILNLVYFLIRWFLVWIIMTQFCILFRRGSRSAACVQTHSHRKVLKKGFVSELVTNISKWKAVPYTIGWYMLKANVLAKSLLSSMFLSTWCVLAPVWPLEKNSSKLTSLQNLWCSPSSFIQSDLCVCVCQDGQRHGAAGHHPSCRLSGWSATLPAATGQNAAVTGQDRQEGV